MPDSFVALLNFAPLFAPPEILECYLSSFDGELAPPSIEWGQCTCRLAWGRGHRGNRIAMQTGSNTPLFGGAGASSLFLLFATGSNRPILLKKLIAQKVAYLFVAARNLE
ncbi:hypothetical protein IDZ75_19745 [Pseudomonas aeruginosa]|uniref:hypothetical protein n=1 Tax=Pseudomonas aeruginosa TaxID=287 RepID=UPI001ADBA984|nr:hypothetical protein [Pseudomonas aeruginosa]MBO8354488.1 hypothetical protein [Pseudomonas aeruginosa]